MAAGRMAWQSLLGLLLAVMAVYAPVVGLLQLYGTIQLSLPSLDRLEGILHAAREIEDRPGARRLLSGPTTIELRDLSFGYGGKPALTGVSAVIRRGSKGLTALTSPGGARRSEVSRKYVAARTGEVAERPSTSST